MSFLPYFLVVVSCVVHMSGQREVLRVPSLRDVEQAAEVIRGIAELTPLVRFKYDCPTEFHTPTSAVASDESEATLLAAASQAPCHGEYLINIYLKLETLQPINSFKVRGAANAVAQVLRQRCEEQVENRTTTTTDHARRHELLPSGVVTPSAGNMAQGVAYVCERWRIPCHAVVPLKAAQTKLDGMARLGMTFDRVPFPDWWQVILSHQYSAHPGILLHPVCSNAVLAGNGTIGLEVVQQLQEQVANRFNNSLNGSSVAVKSLRQQTEVAAVLVPYGGGALMCGIAGALRAISTSPPHAGNAATAALGVYACEVEENAPLHAALHAEPPGVTKIVSKDSFVDGIGSGSVLEEMWPLASSLVTDSLLVSPKEVAEAIRLLVERNKVVAEGAGAAAVACALRHLPRLVREWRERRAHIRKDKEEEDEEAGPLHVNIVCVISGGGIDTKVLEACLRGETPPPSCH